MWGVGFRISYTYINEPQVSGSSYEDSSGSEGPLETSLRIECLEVLAFSGPCWRAP